jgi:integration host factor subunit alpha
MADNTLTRSDLVEEIYTKAKVTRSDATLLLDTVLDAVAKSLGADGTVKVNKFGQFVIRDKEERIGRNPKTGVEVKIPARRVVAFKPSQTLKRNVEEAA